MHGWPTTVWLRGQTWGFLLPQTRPQAPLLSVPQMIDPRILNGVHTALPTAWQPHEHQLTFAFATACASASKSATASGLSGVSSAVDALGSVPVSDSRSACTAATESASSPVMATPSLERSPSTKLI